MEKQLVTASSCDVGMGTAFGTFGELLQGALPRDRRDFLVTLPIACWSTAMFYPDLASEPVRIEPAHKLKSLRMARIMLDRCGWRGGGVLVLDSDLPEGKGLASSSADLVATARAIGHALSVEITAVEVEAALRGIEPSDGVMYPGVVVFYHREVRLREQLGSLPRLSIVGIDEGGEVDTLQFNTIPKPFTHVDRRRYRRLLYDLSRAVRDGDLYTVGRVATESAYMNQGVRPKRTLAAMDQLCRRAGGFGVVVAHSGTQVGILLAHDDPDYQDKLAYAVNCCRALAGNVTIYQTLRFD